MEYFLAANDLIGFLKCEMRNAHASRDEAVVAAVRELRAEFDAKDRETQEILKE